VLIGKVTRHGRAWRMADVVAAMLALVVLAPLMACIAVAIVIDDRGPILFTQWRIGQHGRRFRILKFRTMAPSEDAPASAAPLRQLDDHPAVTRVGRWLRRSHLDELPQLANVVLGQMSMVGPRPLVPDEDALITRAWKERHDHRPGLTGTWQIWRSRQTTVDELIGLDQIYLAGWTPWRDVRLVASTARCVVRRSGR
jgi:lipopolysaccharide/colanic/teichoic acid biosynthesis glycosyltransferase